MNKWDKYFLDMAWHVSSMSKDPSTKTGAVIVGPKREVIGVGFNGFPQGMPDKEEYYNNREEKYSRIVHCEMNALIFAGRPLPEGCTLYTVPFLSCDRCIVHMLQAGIKSFIAPECPEDKKERWETILDKTKGYITECGGTYALY